MSDIFNGAGVPAPVVPQHEPGQPIGEQPSLAEPRESAPASAVEAFSQTQNQSTIPARDDAGRWISQAEWTARNAPNAQPQPNQPQQPTPLFPEEQQGQGQPQPAPQPEQPQVDYRVLYEQQQQQLVQSQQAQQAQALAAQRAMAEQQREAQWGQQEQAMLQRVEQLPAADAIAATRQFYAAREQDRLTRQYQAANEAIGQRDQLFQSFQQQAYRSAYPQYVQHEAQQAGLGALTEAEVAEVVSVMEQAGPAIAPNYLMSAIAPRRQLAQQMEQFRRTQTVQNRAAQGIYNVSGGSGGSGTAGASGAIPKGGYNSMSDVYAAWGN